MVVVVVVIVGVQKGREREGKTHVICLNHSLTPFCWIFLIVRRRDMVHDRALELLCPVEGRRCASSIFIGLG